MIGVSVAEIHEDSQSVPETTSVGSALPEFSNLSVAVAELSEEIREDFQSVPRTISSDSDSPDLNNLIVAVAELRGAQNLPVKLVNISTSPSGKNLRLSAVL